MQQIICTKVSICRQGGQDLCTFYCDVFELLRKSLKVNKHVLPFLACTVKFRIFSTMFVLIKPAGLLRHSQSCIQSLSNTFIMMLGTFPKSCSQEVHSQKLFPKRQVFNCAIYQVATSQVCPSRIARSQSFLVSAIGLS